MLKPLLAAALIATTTVASAEPTSADNDQLRAALRRYPAADANGDGVLTTTEARAYRRSLGGSEPQTGKIRTASPSPTFADVKYGPHERNVLDFWQAKSDGPAPLVVFIHGGGFRAGDKSSVRGNELVRACLDAGVSFAAINYRFRPETPIQDILRDCARAIQFLRSKSGEWNIDKTRVASYGGSAGAGTSLWLAFHDDLADPASDDPVLRESTRLTCAGANSTQATYDIVAWKSIFGDAVARYETVGDWPAFYGLKTADDLTSPEGERLRADCDMLGLISKDDPPVFLHTTQPGGEVTDRGHLLHHPKHAEAVMQRCRDLGVPAIADLPGLKTRPAKEDPQDLREFLFRHLGVEKTK